MRITAGLEPLRCKHATLRSEVARTMRSMTDSGGSSPSGSAMPKMMGRVGALMSVPMPALPEGGGYRR